MCGPGGETGDLAQEFAGEGPRLGAVGIALPHPVMVVRAPVLPANRDNVMRSVAPSIAFGYHGVPGVRVRLLVVEARRRRAAGKLQLCAGAHRVKLTPSNQGCVTHNVVPLIAPGAIGSVGVVVQRLALGVYK